MDVTNFDLNEELKLRVQDLATTYISPYTISTTNTSKQLNDNLEEQQKDIESLKNAMTGLNCRVNNQDNRMWEIQEQIQEALAIMRYPGLIANRMLDKVEQFISKYKKVFTDKKSGKTLEIVEVSQLEGMVRELREVVKNGNNSKDT